MRPVGRREYRRNFLLSTYSDLLVVMTRMSKPKKNPIRRRRNNRSNNSNQNGTQERGDSRRLPSSTSVVDKRPKYNPTWNPQYLKVARTFQISAPPADVGAGFGKYFDPAVTPSATLLAYNSSTLTFNISDVPSISEFTTLFDQYRFSMVSVLFEYITASETVSQPAAALSQQVTLLVYEDNDDSTAPTASNVGWQAVYESGRAVRKVFPNKTNQLVYNLKPKYLVAENDTAGTTLGRSLGAGWTDAATTDVQWRGLKWILQANPTTATTAEYNFRMTATYYIELRARQ
jgi:hypothetical protein